MRPRGTLKPVYNYIDDLPALGGAVHAVPAAAIRSRKTHRQSSPPSMPGAAVRSSARSAPSSTCRAASRAAASPDDVEHILRQNCEHGIDRFFITDDNFARNKDWEAIFDRIIELREQRQAWMCAS